MKRKAIVLIALVVAGAALAVADPQAGAAPRPANYVLVDPADLRQPVPDPQDGLSAKYDGQVVRFTGVLTRAALDAKAKQTTAELRYDIVHQLTGKNKKAVVVGRESIVVPVRFQGAERQLQGRKPGYTLTVQGRGSIMVDGTLVITEAVIVTPNQGLFSK
jgi:hypothetical protein